ncbi:MAG: hypothetical protein ACK5QT_07010 [Oligoflexia bacterium]
MKLLGVGFVCAAVSLMAATAQAFLPQVGVYGPNGARIAFKRTGPKGSEMITIREFEPLTRSEEIEEGERVTRKIQMPETAFRELLKLKLESMDQRILTPEQRELLKGYLAKNLPFDADLQSELADLTNRLRRIEAALKEEGETDYLVNLKASTESKLQDVREAIAFQSEMDGAELKRVLKHEDDKGGIVFNLLHEMVSIKKCGDLSGVQKPGTTCITSQGVVFVRVSKPEAGWRAATANGKTWFDAVKTNLNHAEARAFCKRPGFALPTQEDYESFRAYFERTSSGYFTGAGREELYALFPNMKDNWFWSDTEYPVDSGGAYVFSGSLGAIYVDDRSLRYVPFAVRCVSAPSVDWQAR